MEKKDFKKELATSGLKNTKHRTEILEILNMSDQPIPAEQVYLELLNSWGDGQPVHRIQDAGDAGRQGPGDEDQNFRG